MKRMLILLLTGFLILGTVSPAFANGVTEDLPAAEEVLSLPPDAGSEIGPVPEVDPQLDPEADPEPDPEADPEPDPETDPEPDPETDPEPEALLEDPAFQPAVLTASLLAQEPNPDIVFDEDSLKMWLANHTEGTVTLGASITIGPPAHWTQTVRSNGNVTIDTQSHSLVFDGGHITSPSDSNTNRLTIKGEGVDAPVLIVKDAGYLQISNWNNALCVLDITATGRGTAGGTALRIDYDPNTFGDKFQFGWPQLDRSPGRISAFGENAVGLEFNDPQGDGDVNLLCFDVRVEGKNSVAVLAPQGANLCFCKLSASGEGAQSIRSGGDVVVDVCKVTPAPTGANVTVCQAQLVGEWVPIKSHTGAADLVQTIPFLAPGAGLAGNSRKTSGYSIAVDWDPADYESIDTSVLGRSTIVGEVVSPWFAELLPGTADLLIDVLDPEIPYIFSADVVNGFAELEFWMCDAWELDACTLWSSTDGGKTWQDITAAPDVTWKETNKKVYNYTLMEMVPLREGKVSIPAAMVLEGGMFLLEAEGFGESNPAQFSSAFPNKLPDAGGDRIGTDRMGVRLSGAKPAPPDPDPDPPSNPGPPAKSPAPGKTRDDGDDDVSERGAAPGVTWGAGSSLPAPEPPNAEEETPQPATAALPATTSAAAAAPVTASNLRPLPEPLPATPAETPAEAPAEPQPPAPQTPAEAPAAAVTPPEAVLSPQPETVAQPELPEPGGGVGTAIAVTSALAVAVGGWLWVSRLRGAKK